MAARTDRACTLLALILLGAACRVGPRYERPSLDVPGEYRGELDDTSGTESFADAKWSEVFRDEELQKLVARALVENYDIRIAVARILQARAQLTITRADQFPTVSGDLTATRERTPATGRGGFAVPRKRAGRGSPT